jgi:hypothetical protein
MQVLQGRKPVEQTLQWLFLHRNHLLSANESILWRELPTCCAGEAVEGRADLLAFDQTLAQPILVELKDGDADDPLSGAVLELLYHWAFHLQHVQHFHALLAEFGYVPACPCRLALVAPESYYATAEARSPRRNNEYKWAMGWIGGLSRANLVSIDLYAIEPGWLAAGAGFRIGKLRQP